MNFPSRGLRVSATTTLKYGRFNAPSLRNLIATAMLFSHSQHFELGQEIVEIERRAAQFSFEALRVFDLDRFGRFFNQTDDVTHSENPAGQTLGHKRLELIELFTGADKFNRPPRHFAHGQGRAPARVAVEFR